MINIDLEDLRKKCNCGQSHNVDVNEIVIKEGAINEIPRLIEKYDFKNTVIICDNNTYLAAGKQIGEMLLNPKFVILNADNLHANEHGVEAAKDKLPNNCDLILAVGSGTIHDISRYIAYNEGIRFFSVPTAASVDGFVSTVAAMTWNGFKKSFTAISPMCVIADTSIFMEAPKRLTASGVADLLGKYTALVDWHISHILTNEHICQRICSMEEAAIDEVKNNIYGICNINREVRIKAYEALMYGLLLSGLAMQMTGNSRPASGAEHHLSHVWEMELINKHIDAYHGEKVGVGLCIACDTYHMAAKKMNNDLFSVKMNDECISDLINITSENKKVICEMLKENEPNPLLDISIKTFIEEKDRIIGLLEALPRGEEVRKILKIVDAPTTMSELGLDESLLIKSIELSPYVRKRITFMRLLKLCSFYKELI